jgi:hypothetical protein
VDDVGFLRVEKAHPSDEMVELERIRTEGVAGSTWSRRARALLPFLALLSTLAACGDRTAIEPPCEVDSGISTLPVCAAPTTSAVLDVETCVDYQDLGWCRWLDDTAPDVQAVACVAPSGVRCVDQCPANHYGVDGGAQ